MFDMYNITGNAKVFVKAINKLKINGIEYEQDEPITIINKANVEISYDVKNTLAKGVYQKLGTQEIKPESVIIKPDGFNASMYNLLGKKINKELKQTHYKEYTSTAGGEMYLTNNISLGDSIFVYDENREKVVGYGLDYDENKIHSIAASTTYKVVHVSKTTEAGYDLNVSHIPYVSLEIVVDGNTDGSSKKTHIIVPKVFFNIAPQLTIDTNDMLVPILYFGIINNTLEVYYK